MNISRVGSCGAAMANLSVLSFGRPRCFERDFSLPYHDRGPSHLTAALPARCARSACPCSGRFYAGALLKCNHSNTVFPLALPPQLLITHPSWHGHSGLPGAAFGEAAVKSASFRSFHAHNRRRFFARRLSFLLATP